MPTETLTNPIESNLIEKGYVLQPKLNEYAKPRYRKGNDEVIVCWHCGWVTVNGIMYRFSSYTFNHKFINLIP